MARNPFGELTRKHTLAARLQRWRRGLLRPFRPSRLPGGRSGPPNFLLLGVDTLRCDHLGCGGYPQPTSPWLDRLARNGTVFTDVTAPAPWTLPSFSSALTGLMPGLHGGFLPGPERNMDDQPPRRLNEEVVTLAAHLRRQGYRTAAFYSNQFFAFGLAESFDHHSYHNFAADDLAALALDWIRRHSDRPWLCFVLFNDPHEPTTPCREDLEPFLPAVSDLGAPCDDQALRDLARWGEGSAPDLGQAPVPADARTDKYLAVKLAIYDATIRMVDRTIGLMQGKLRGWQLAESSLVTVFSDHGEEFLDHAAQGRQWSHDPRGIAGIGHGHSHFQELLHVPWISWGPRVPAGVRRGDPVSLLDLAPTLLDWAQLPPLPKPAMAARLETRSGVLAAGLVGRSRADDPAIRSDDLTIGTDDLLLAEAIAYGPDLVALRKASWKLIAYRDGRVLSLFDLAADPAEEVDVADRHPEVVADLLNHLACWRETGLGAGGKDDGGSWGEMDDTIRKRLQDLGYSE